MRIKIIAAILCSLFIWKHSNAQFLRAKLGTDIPMQYLIGLNYQHGKIFHADISGGYIATPYNGDLYRVISVPERHQARKEFLMETTDDGWVFGLGVNANFGKWYAGIFGQHITINASATYEYLLSSELYTEALTDNDRLIIDAFLDSEVSTALTGGIDFSLQDKMEVQTRIIQAGLKVGRRFFFGNNRWEVRTEFAFSKNMYSKTESTYDEELFNDVKDAYQLYKSSPTLQQFIETTYGFSLPTNTNLDAALDFESKEVEVDDFFHQYGYIPTLNLHLTYLLWVPKKVKAEQEKMDGEASTF